MPLYPEIYLNILQNAGRSVFPNGVPYPTIQQNTSRLTNSTDNLFIVKAIDEGTHVLGLDLIECIVADLLASDHLFFLLITSALTLDTPE